jgi:NAD(P)-dependent dehydrogenase (short-subunit alcohol dehydrogenase family)
MRARLLALGCGALATRGQPHIQQRRTVIELRGLSGKKVLITGGSKGQGFSHAKAFASAGCDIAILDLTDAIEDFYPLGTPETLLLAVSAIEATGQQVVGIPCDIRDEKEVEASIGKVLDAFDGRIDVVVNNAGIGALDPIHKMRSNVLHASIDTMVKGTMFVTKYASDNMIGRRSGCIINTSSATALGAFAMASHYVAAKSAIIGLTTSWAAELSEFNINVNAVCPGSVRPGAGQGSGMVLGMAAQAGMPPDEAFEMFSSQYNFAGDKWRVEMRHVTDAVLFLASDNAAMITGSTIPVDGGQMAK